MIKILSLLLLVTMVVVVTQATWAHAEVETPFQHGYSDGLADGKVSGSDATDSCSQYNSTLDNTQCSRGYDLGFKKGCLLEGDKLPFDPSPEYGQCRDG